MSLFLKLLSRIINLQIRLTDLPNADELVMEPMAEAYEREVKAQQLILWLPELNCCTC